MSKRKSLCVTHLVDKYLPYSQTWIYPQIVRPPGVQAAIIAFTTVDDGPRRFPPPRLTALHRSSPVRHFLHRCTDPLGFRLLGPAVEGALSKQPPDLVHAHFGPTAWRCLPAVRQHGLPLVSSFYGYDMSELPAGRPKWRRRYGELFEFGNLFLCEGPAMADGLVRLGCPVEKIGINPLGVDVSRFVFSKRILGAGGTLKVLATARFKEKKGLPDAIAAVVRASRSANVHLTIVGGPADGREGRRETARIRETMRRLRAHDHVSFAGVLPYDELIRRAEGFHVMLQPSKRASTGDTEGGAPVALLEMAATGMAAVSTRHADIPRIVVDGYSGFLVEEGDVQGLADRLVRLAGDPQLVATMGESGARHARAEFDQGACAETLRSHYDAVVGI